MVPEHEQRAGDRQLHLFGKPRIYWLQLQSGLQRRWHQRLWRHDNRYQQHFFRQHQQLYCGRRDRVAHSNSGTGPDSPGGTLNVINSTFSDNSASGTGGGAIGNGNGATVTNSILAGSGVSGNCGELAVTNGGYNISDDGSCGFGTSTGANAKTIGDNVNALLDPAGLKDNGGPTQTIGVQSTSPAIAAVPLAACKVSTDQPGLWPFAPGFDACDIGAFEYNAEPTVTFNTTVGGRQGPWSYSDALNAGNWYGPGFLQPTVISALRYLVRRRKHYHH